MIDLKSQRGSLQQLVHTRLNTCLQLQVSTVNIKSGQKLVANMQKCCKIQPDIVKSFRCRCVSVALILSSSALLSNCLLILSSSTS